MRGVGALGEAVRAMAGLDEVTVQAMADSGDLEQRVLRLDGGSDAGPLSRFDDVHEAPSRPMTEAEYRRWLRG